MKPKPKPSIEQPQDTVAQELHIPELRLLVLSHQELRRNPLHLQFIDAEDTDEASTAAVEWYRLH